MKIPGLILSRSPASRGMASPTSVFAQAGAMAALCLIAQPPSVTAQEQVPEISVETLGENLWVIRDGLGS